MTKYDLSNVPNQSFSTTVNGHSFEFTFHSYRGLTYCDAVVDGVLVQAGVPATPNVGIFGGLVTAVANGEFLFVCTTDDYPSYDLFNENTCFFAFKERGE